MLFGFNGGGIVVGGHGEKLLNGWLIRQFDIIGYSYGVNDFELRGSGCWFIGG